MDRDGAAYHGWDWPVLASKGSSGSARIGSDRYGLAWPAVGVKEWQDRIGAGWSDLDRLVVLWLGRKGAYRIGPHRIESSGHVMSGLARPVWVGIA